MLFSNNDTQNPIKFLFCRPLKQFYHFGPLGNPLNLAICILLFFFVILMLFSYNDTKNPFNLAFCQPLNYEVVLSLWIQ